MITTPASVAVMPRVEWNQPPDRSTAVVCAMTVHIHPVTFAAARAERFRDLAEHRPGHMRADRPQHLTGIAERIPVITHNPTPAGPFAAFVMRVVIAEPAQMEWPAFWKNVTIASAPPINTAAAAATTTPIFARDA